MTGEGTALAGLGVEVDAEEADAIFAGLAECGDLGEMFVREIVAVGGTRVADPVSQCLEAKLDDSLLREIVMTRLVEGDAAFADKPEITAKLVEFGRSCAAGS